jgi:hypothetical protein
MTKMMVLHPERIMNLGRLDSALTLAITLMARYIRIMVPDFLRISPTQFCQH